MIQLPEAVQVIKKEGKKAIFEIGPLAPGYGATIANPLRRVLLSSLEGAAITSIKIKGVDHEFGAITGVQEDVIQLLLNLKKLRFRCFSDEAVTVLLTAKGETEVTGADIQLTADVELVNPEQYLCTLTEKKAVLEIEVTVQKGRGYIPAEQRQKEKLPIGVIAVDAVYSPVHMVNFSVDDVRVGQRIDYNKIVLEIETDGTIMPEQALRDASIILREHFDLVSQVAVPDIEVKAPKKAKKTVKDKED